MFLVCYWTGGISDGSLFVVQDADPGFATEEAAQAWITQQVNPSAYMVVQCFPPPPVTPPGSILAVPVVPGQMVVVRGVFNLGGGSEVLLYGPFASEAAAKAWIAQLAYPGGCEIETVQTAKQLSV